MSPIRTVIVEAPGGPERLKFANREVGEPGPGEIRIRHKAIGLNFIDIYQRSGLYPQPYPVVLGAEAAGVVEAVGAGVGHLKPGDRAAYASGTPGAYCDARVMPAAHVCPIPDAVGFDEAAALMLKGMTAQYLLRRTVAFAPGDTVLFHAAAGGVGQIACQWAKADGLTLLGTAGSDEKCALAAAAGAAHVVNYRTETFVDRVREITGGKGVRAVMDSVGKDTFDGSLDCLSPFGTLILFGASSGPVPPFELQRLAAGGSLFVTRPTLFTHIADPATCQQMARELFEMVTSGKIRVRIDHRYPLDRVAEAHRALEARRTTGSTVLVP